MKSITKASLYICFLAFLGVGLLLVSGHPGQAIKVANYLFAILSVGIIIGFISNE